jgi:lactose/cellobiose-specific phosphotransferase system IIC component
MTKVTGFKVLFAKLHQRLQNNLALTAIRHGLLYLIPILFIGSIALVLAGLPIPIYQHLIGRGLGEDWQNALLAISNGTFGILAILMLLGISYAFTVEFNARNNKTVSPIIVCVVALASLITLTGQTSPDMTFSKFGAMNVFFAVTTALISSYMFLKLSGVPLFLLKTFSQGANAQYIEALSWLFPTAITIGFFGATNAALAAWWDITNISLWFSDMLVSMFSWIQSKEIASLLFVLLIHAFWLLGIHGNKILEPVNQQLFGHDSIAGQQLLLASQDGAEIFSRSFFNVFLFMGGCGCAMSLMLAILLFSRQKTDKNVARLSMMPTTFNMNELLLFGLPIVLNPIYAIPFVAAPLILGLISYAATIAGWVPVASNYVGWTTPIFLSGYAATGSIRGSFLQLFNLIVGIIIYMPFVRWSDAMSKERMKSSLEKLYILFKPFERQGSISLLTRSDEVGILARKLADDLRDDLQQGKLTLFYQPQVNARKEVFGMEALLRWRHPEFGLIYPPLVIALAEEAGLMEKLGYWITDTACGELKRLETLSSKKLTMSVNISGVQLENKELLQELDEILARYHLSPCQLEIEMTEQIALTSSQAITDRIQELKNRGVKLAMDDFGMGRSSLLYLKEYDFDTVKLDGSLVREILDNQNCREIISSIVYLSSSLGFSVLAEFVEYEAQASILEEIGCTRYQGYLYSKPLPPEELHQFLEAMEAEAPAS